MPTDNRSDVVSGVGPNLAGDGTEVSWHRDGSGNQIVLGVESDGVRLAVAFPADARRADLEAVLAERDRELQHYFEALASADV